MRWIGKNTERQRGFAGGTPAKLFGSVLVEADDTGNSGDDHQDGKGCCGEDEHAESRGLLVHDGEHGEVGGGEGHGSVRCVVDGGHLLDASVGGYPCDVDSVSALSVLELVRHGDGDGTVEGGVGAEGDGEDGPVADRALLLGSQGGLVLSGVLNREGGVGGGVESLEGGVVEGDSKKSQDKNTGK